MAEKMVSIKRYPCILCGQEGFTEHQMKAHIALEHFESDAACPFCDTRCQCPAHLIRHINKNHPEIFGPSSPEQNINISAFHHSRKGSKRRSKQTHPVERFRQDGENDVSPNGPARFDLVGIPTTRLSSLGKNNGCKCDCERDCSSDSSLNTDEVNKLMIGKIRASGGSEHPKQSGATHSETCAGKCRVTDAAPGKYFFERDRSAAREKKPLGENKENHGNQKQTYQKHGKFSAQRKNLNIISDDSDSDEQIVSRREVSRGGRGSYECCVAANACAERCKQSASDVKKPPFEDPVHRQDKARHEKSHREREEHRDMKASSKGSSPCKQHEFNCPICPFGTNCRQTIIAHVQDMHAEELDGAKDCGCHVCPVCSKKFPCPETLQSHVHAVHKDILKTPESKRKRSERHGQPAFQSGVSLADSDPTGLNKKQGADSGARAKVCCSKSCAGSDPQSSSDGLTSCQLCGIIVNNREDLLQHLAWAHPEKRVGVGTCCTSAPQKTYCCLLCDAEFGNRDELQSHVQTVHSQGQARLPEGAAAQDSQGKALGHNRSAIQDTQERRSLSGKGSHGQGTGPFQAQSAMPKTQSADLTSKASSNLPRELAHKDTVVTNKPSKASRSLLRGSVNEGMMVSHNASRGTLSLPGDSANECTVCRSRFPSKDDLMRHLVWVHGGGPPQREFICNQCHSHFQSEKALQDHKEVIHFPRAMRQRPSLIRSRNPSVDIMHHGRGSQVHRHSSCNVSGSNQRPLLNMDAEIIDAVCPVCQKSLPRISMAGFQAHVDSHFEENKELGESSQMKYCQLGSSGKDFWSTKRYNTMIAHIRGPLEVDQEQYQHHCFPHAKEPALDEGISRTDGIIERLHEYFRPALPDNVAHVWLCAPIAHYASTAADRGWGCGYRNFQMMISCLLDRREYYAALLQGGDKAEGSKVPSSQARPGYMPSIGRIQAMLEEAWRDGFDPEGRDQLEGVVFNTCKWIGATELVAILSHCGIKTKLTDFPQPTGPNGTHPALFKWVLNYFTSPTTHLRPPLYLQHQGHSRTIIGIEQLNSGDLRLLVFDPGKETKLMDRFKWNLNTTTVNLLRRSMHALKARQYQVLALDGFLTEEEREKSKIIRSERIM